MSSRHEHGPGLDGSLVPRPADRAVQLVWIDRVLTSTGSTTFRLSVPVAGPPPGPSAIDALVEAIQQVCWAAASSPDGVAIRTVRGHAASVSELHGHLSIYLTTTQAGPDAHRDGAYVASVVRLVVRRIGSTWWSPGPQPLTEGPGAAAGGGS